MNFLHIGKTGGTAIAHALRPYCDDLRQQIVFHPHYVTLRQIPVGERVIFAVRDPVARFVSGFNSRRRQGMPRYHYPWRPAEAVAFAIFARASDLATSLSSPHEHVRAQAGDAMRSIQHVQQGYGYWLEDVGYLKSRRPDIAWVGRTECLAADFEALCSLLEIPPGCALPTDPVLSHRRLDSDDVQLDEVGITNIRRWYADDYEILAYLLK